MTDFFIQIKDGQPFEHPIASANFQQAFPDIDVNNLPESYAHFVRVATPAIGVYQVYEGVTYEWDNGVVTDVHHVRAMTPEEVTAKQDTVKADWADFGYPSWIWHEAACYFRPPVARPQDGNQYRWDEATISWVVVD